MTHDRPFSVLVPVYPGTDPAEADLALESCFDQTAPPAEILLVVEGDLPESLDSVLETWETRHQDVIRRHGVPGGCGLGESLRTGVQECRNPLIARFDADDVNVRSRFETQLEYLENHPEVDVVGSYIGEFVDDPADPVSVRAVPTDHEEIERFARFRNPVNHMTVMFRREAVLSAGNYRPLEPLEDYDLWVRMLCDGATFANVPTPLVRARAGTELSARRGGISYAIGEVRQQVSFYRRGFTDLPTFLRNVVVRGGVRLLPNRIRAYVYSRWARTDT